MFSKKATKIDEIFTVDLTLCSKCQIDVEDFVNFCGLLRKREVYLIRMFLLPIVCLVLNSTTVNCNHATPDVWEKKCNYLNMI